MSENTPAPWRLSHTHYEEGGRTVGYTNVIGPDGDDIGVTIYNTGSQDTWGARRRSDAALIAAAPELLDALGAAAGYLLNAKIDLETGCAKATAIKTIEGGLTTIRAAIAKATGAA